MLLSCRSGNWWWRGQNPPCVQLRRQNHKEISQTKRSIQCIHLQIISQNLRLNFSTFGGFVLLTVRFAGWHIREEEEAEVLAHREGQVQAGQETLGELGIKTRIVQAEVAEGHEEPRSRVQSDAETPYVRLGAETYWGTDGWQVIGNLDTHTHIVLVFRAHLFQDLWEEDMVCKYDEKGYLTVCPGGIVKMKGRGYEDTCHQSKQRQTHGSYDTCCEGHPQDERPLMAKDVRAWYHLDLQ